MNRSNGFTFGIVLLLATAVHAGEATDTKRIPNPDPQQGGDVQIQSDPAFDHYVDFVELGSALAAMDAARVADAGLQMAEGERILFRQHRSLSADGVLCAAARLASQSQDKQTLQRLQAYAKSSGRAALVKQLEADARLGSASRALTAKVDVEQTSPADYALLCQMRERIELASCLRDVAALESIEGELNAIDRISESVLKMLRTELADAKKTLGSTSAASSDDRALAYLADFSRSIPVDFKRLPRPKPPWGPPTRWPPRPPKLPGLPPFPKPPIVDVPRPPRPPVPPGVPKPPRPPFPRPNFRFP